MGDKKPPLMLGNLVGTGSKPPLGGRLDSLNSNRDANVAMKPPMKFKPHIVARKETKGDDIDTKLKGILPSLLDESTFQQNRRSAQSAYRPKFAGRGVDSKAGITAKSPFTGGTSTGAPSSFKKRDDGSGDAMDIGDSVAPIKRHDLEIDSSNPDHPSVLPFVDPQRQKELTALQDKEKEESIIMTGIKHELAMLEKEEENAVPDELISAIDIPTPLMEDSDFLNEDNLFFIQLPSSLPFTLPPPTDPNNNNNNNTTNTNNNNTPSTTNTTTPPAAQKPPQKNPNEYVNTLRGVNGHLGKIVVYKSGKVKFKVGDILYDVTAANNPNFLEELMVLDGSACYRVGPMSQHLIVTPGI